MAPLFNGMTEARDRRRQHFESHVFGRPVETKRSVRESDSFRSTVFAKPEPKTARFNPHKPEDHHSSDFYQVSTVAPPSVQHTISHFQPTYKYEQQLLSRHQLRASTPQPVRTYEPVLKEYNSRKPGVNTSYSKPQGIEKAKEINTRTVTPVEKREVIQVGNEENEPKKKTDEERNFVDWFGRPRQNQTIRREKTPTVASWKDARFEARTMRSSESYSPAAFRDQQLRSSLDPPSPVVKTPQVHNYTPFTPQNPKDMKRLNLNQFDIPDLPRPSEAQLATFLIKGLAASADSQSVRSLCQGLHIVTVEPELDDIKGSCRGQAKVVLRHFPGENTVERLVDQVKDAGLDIEREQKDVGRKNNYKELAGRTFLDHQLQLEERQFGEPQNDPKLSKQRLLGSAADLFGSSSALSQYYTKVNKPRDNSDKHLRQWETVKKGRSQTPGTASTVRADMGFLRPTESWKNKAK